MTRRVVLSSIAFSFFAAAPAAAQTSPVCQPVFNAMAKVVITPHHMTSTQSNSPTVGEMITAGGANYIKIGGAWKKSPMTPQDNIQQQQENIKNAKSYTCKHLPDEVVDGAPATVYGAHSETEGLGSTDANIWISKASGLPLRSEQDLGGDRKMHISVKYDYVNITAPVVK